MRRYHVSLGGESIGYHRFEDGAKALAVSHAHRVTTQKNIQPFTVVFQRAAAGP